MRPTPFLVTAILSYLLGSIPFGYLLVRMVTGEDVRASGSGNIGATNVARKSRVLGIATLVLDAAKGFAAVFFAWLAFIGPHRHLFMAVAALCAVLGHLFPVWLKFRGGKGVATSFGAFVLLTPKTILCLVGLFLLLAVAFRYVSLGSVAVAAAFPVLSVWPAISIFSDGSFLSKSASVWRMGQSVPFSLSELVSNASS